MMTVEELAWLIRLMNSDDPLARELGWYFYRRRCEAEAKRTGS